MIVSIDYTEPAFPRDDSEPDYSAMRDFARANYRAVEIRDYDYRQVVSTTRFEGQGFMKDWANAMAWIQAKGEEHFMVSSTVDDFAHDAGYDLTEEGPDGDNLVLTDARP